MSRPVAAPPADPRPSTPPAAPAAPPRAARLRRLVGRRGPGERWAIAQFVLSALAAVALVLVVSLVAFERAGRDAAIGNAREVTRVAARGVIAPQLDADVLAGRPDALAGLERVVRASLLVEPVLRVVIFRADGSVLWSSERAPAGGASDAGAEPQVAQALRTGGDVTRTGPPRDPASDLPEGTRVLDVFEPVRAPGGEAFVVKTCRRLAAVSADGRRLLDQFAPYLVGGVLVLQLVNLPLVLALVRRIRRARRHDQLLLQRELAASDQERRRLATDLHNGVIQDLAGMSMSLAALRTTAVAAGDADGARRLGAVAADARRATRMLRHVLVDLYPPNLQRAGLRNALDDLLESARRRDIAVSCSVDAAVLDGLGPDRAALVHRVVHEALRNVVAHSGARQVHLGVDRAEHGGVVVRVADDGRGFAPEHATGQTGHFGLALMRDLVEMAGGHLTVTSAPGDGTTVRAHVPAR